MRKFFVIAGEASGDLHASNLIKQLNQQQPNLQIEGWGGELMQAQGVTIKKHYRDLAFMGFVEVIKNISAILRNFKLAKAQIKSFQPDTIILVDYPGFNLRIAKWAKLQGFTIVYYISPQIWAWKEHRVHSIKKYVDQMLVILPFEKAFYEKWGYTVQYVGHPLAKLIADFRKDNKENSTKTCIALLPGSRKQEIAAKLPLMVRMATLFPNEKFYVAQAPSQGTDVYAPFLQGTSVQLYTDGAYSLLAKSKAALVTSGTATLETALFGVPEVVCYKGNKISYWIAKRLIKVKYISLVNLIMDRLVVQELIQDEYNEQQLSTALRRLLENVEYQLQVAADYDTLLQILIHGGDASYNAAKLILGKK
jgi:lipid-A-disaccharide synthase